MRLRCQCKDSCSWKDLEWQELVKNLTRLIRKTPITTSQRQHSELFRAFRTVARRPLSSIWRRHLANFKLTPTFDSYFNTIYFFLVSWWTFTIRIFRNTDLFSAVTIQDFWIFIQILFYSGFKILLIKIFK